MAQYLGFYAELDTKFVYLVKKVKALDSCREGGRFDSFCDFSFLGFWNDADYRDYVDDRYHGLRDDVQVCVAIERAPWHVYKRVHIFKHTRVSIGVYLTCT